MKKKSHRIFLVLIIIFALLTTTIISIPLIISTNPGKEFVVRQINRHIPGNIAIKSLSLRWLGSINLEQVAFNDITGNHLLNFQLLSISRGLLHLIFDYKNFGEIKLLNPRINIAANTAPASSGSGKTSGNNKNKPAKKEDTKKEEEKTEDAKIFQLPDIRGTITIENGNIQITSNNTAQTVLSDISAELKFDGTDKPIAFKLNCTPGNPDSSCSGSGTLTLPDDGTLNINKIALNTKLKVTNLDLTPISTIAAIFSPTPQIQGILNTDIAVTGNMDDGLDVETSMSVDSLAIPEQKAEFGNIKLGISAKASKTSLNLQKAFITSSFCNVDATGNYGITGGTGAITAKADIDTEKTISFLKNMSIITNDISCTGNIQAEITGNADNNNISIKKGTVKLNNINLNIEQKKLQLDTLTFDTSADISPKSRKVFSPQTVISSSFGNIKFTDLNIDDWNTLPASLKTGIYSDGIDLKMVRDSFSDFVTFPTNWIMSGKLKMDLKVDCSKSTTYKFDLQTSIPELELQSTTPVLTIKDAPELALNITTSPDFQNITVNKGIIKSSILNMDITANITKKNNYNAIQASGSWSPNLTELSRYVTAFTDIPLTFSGKKEEPFKIDAAWQGSGESLEISKLEGNAGLFADKIDGFGFHIRSLSVPIKAHDKNVQINIGANINNGTFNLPAIIALNQGKPVISIPDDTTILKDINITTEIADELLGRINPIFTGVTTVNGMLGFHLNHFFWPIDNEKLNTRAFAGSFMFNNVSLIANGLLNDLLDAIKVGNRELNINSAGIDVTCANGRITSSPIHLRVKKYELILAGSAGLDGSLDYQAKVPMTESLVGKSGYKYLANTSLNIPITGTIQKPLLNLRSFESAIGDLIKQTASKAITDELNKQLKNIFK